MTARFSLRGSRTLWLLVLLHSLLLAPLIRSAPAAYAVDPGCTHTFEPPASPNTTTKIDSLDYPTIQPGSVICLQAGTWGNIQLKNLAGSPGNPITIRNTGGTTYITGTTLANGGIGIRNSRYLHITGTGVSDKCGAKYERHEQECGIEIAYALKGIRIETEAGENVDGLEIDHVYIHDVANPARPTDARGINIHPVAGGPGIPPQIVVGFSVHHNYLYNMLGEGIYIGTEPHGQPFEELAKLEDVEASYNRIEQIGYDGIKIKVAIRNVKVHHNVVLRAGQLQNPTHNAGIQIAFSVGEYYNNYVETELEGLVMGRILAHPGTKYYNNVVVGADHCMIMPEDGALIYNNTVVGCRSLGISGSGTGTRIFDNIVAGSATTPIDAPVANRGTNLVMPIESVHFVNPNARDYHLTPISAAVDSGGGMGMFPTFDYDDRARPFGPQPDLGAYECQCASALTEKLFLPALRR